MSFIEESIIKEQLLYFQELGSGCIFSAKAAKKPLKYGWNHFCCEPKVKEIDGIVEAVLSDDAISTTSIIFPSVQSNEDLVNLCRVLEKSQTMFLELDKKYKMQRCLGFRVKFQKDIVSWVSGFGNYTFLPKTRQSPYTSIIFRCKKRPPFSAHMKPVQDGVLHLADMDMQISKDRVFKKYWHQSFIEVKKQLGHSPDLRSAAKTTFAIPNNLF